jgi:hypothetical protein
MAAFFENSYDEATERRMRGFYESLSEKDRRRYAALEAEKLGRGGIKYVSSVVGCSRRTIERAKSELEQLPEDPAKGRIRREGAGRKKATESDPELQTNLFSILQRRTAGDPMRPDVLWTDLSLYQMSDALGQLGTPLSPPAIKQWLESQHIGQRKIAKVLPGGHSPDRNEQFEYIYALREEYEKAGNPWFSIDSKAKEHLGRLYRSGRVYTQVPFRAFDHDFPSWADGRIITHGIYDPLRNHGHLNLGLSCDTSEFACDSFRWFWRRIGRYHYPNATSILWLCDAGGSNSCRQYLFKGDLQRLADEISLEIRVAHYPTYCSKFNPIERRLFPHVTRACQGMLFDTLDTAVGLMRKTATSTGLTATVHVIKRLYEKGRKATDEIKKNLKIIFDACLPKWNYKAVPQ